MRGVIPNYHHSYILFFFFLFLVFALFRPVFSIHTLSSKETLTTSSNRTIVSPGDVFELGFFKTKANSCCWYLGIWYKAIPERTYVWVANRDNPLSNSTGTLKISYNNLVLLDHYETTVWSTNLTKAEKSSPVVAELLANGNLVLRDSKTNEFLWQSFDFPVDTLLPGMKLGWDLKTGYNRFLTSWKSPDDPSTGEFTFKLETQGLPEFYLQNDEFKMYRTGPWNGIWFSGIPKMQNWTNMVSSFTETREEATYTYKVVTNQSIHSRLTMSSSGTLGIFLWSPTIWEWNMLWVSPEDECDLYVICGPNSYCDKKTSPNCYCIKGFVPKNITAWALREEFDGCVRKSPLNGGHGDGFYLMKNMKLPESSRVIVDRRIGLKECQERCLEDGNCTGFANTDNRNGGSGCAMWTGELVDMRNYEAGGQDLYVKLAVDWIT